MYNHNKIEKKWQAYWRKNQTYRFVDDPKKPKYYVLDMFPYPSGKGLHVGHPKGYTATDVMSRFKRLNGFNVLHPIGWDAFGLPAEQYALDTNNDPRTFTTQNIEHFREQLQSLGFDYDYGREVNTTDPNYYKWTQWIFQQLYKKGLAELKDIDVNWCEKLKTVLANEELVTDKNGNLVSERGGHPVIRRPMKQWVLRITAYADQLLSGLDALEWPDSLKSLQRKWIGKTTGFQVPVVVAENKFPVFVKEPGLIEFAKFLVLPVDHVVAQNAAKNDTVLLQYIEKAKKQSERERQKKHQVSFVQTGMTVKNPVNGSELPVIVSDFFSNGHFGIPTVSEDDKTIAEKLGIPFEEIFAADGKIMTGQFVGLRPEQASEMVVQKHPEFQYSVQYKLKDWIFSRQRYWGEPFPIYFDDTGEIYLVDQLPLLLPKTDHFKPSDDGRGPLANLDGWMNFEMNGKIYHHDANTMPQWAGSCWYYLGYLMKQEDGSYLPLNDPKTKEIFSRWMPIDLYIGGQEHAVLHLLYARFWYRFLYEIGVVPNPEPFFKIINQGMILGTNGEKMSKSKGNVINPDEIIRTHGADTLRLYEMFMGPLTASMPWSTDSLDGIRRWLDRVYRVFTGDSALNLAKVNEPSENLQVAYNEFVEKITIAIETQQFNVAISHMMVFINSVVQEKQFFEEYMLNFLVCLSPFAPHLAEELAHILNPALGSIAHAKWPKFVKIVHQHITLPVMVDNRLRDTMLVSIDDEKDAIIEQAKQLPKVAKFLDGTTITKVVFIPNKILNFNTKKS